MFSILSKNFVSRNPFKLQPVTQELNNISFTSQNKPSRTRDVEGGIFGDIPKENIGFVMNKNIDIIKEKEKNNKIILLFVLQDAVCINVCIM